MENRMLNFHNRMSTTAKTNGIHPMIKTKICKSFQLKGSCMYGHHCVFAHGLGDMRNMNMIKGKFCKYSWGECPYGGNCIFLHKQSETYKNYEEKRSSIRIQSTRTCDYVSKCSSALDSETGNAQKVKDTLQTDAEKASVPKQNPQAKASLLKWNKSRKIVDIYADWIEVE